MNKAKAQARRRREESASAASSTSNASPQLSPFTTDLTISAPSSESATHAADNDNHAYTLTPPTTPIENDTDSPGLRDAHAGSAMKETPPMQNAGQVRAQALALPKEKKNAAVKEKAQAFAKNENEDMRAPVKRWRKAKAVTRMPALASWEMREDEKMKMLRTKDVHADTVSKFKHNARVLHKSDSDSTAHRHPHRHAHIEQDVTITTSNLLGLAFILSTFLFGPWLFARLPPLYHPWHSVHSPMPLLKTCASMRLSSSSPYDYFARDYPGFYHPPTGLTNLSYSHRIYHALPMTDEPSSILLVSFLTNTVAVERLVNDASFTNFASSWAPLDEYRKRLAVLSKHIDDALSAASNRTTGVSFLLPSTATNLVATAIAKLSFSTPKLSPNQEKGHAIAQIMSAFKIFYPLEQNLIQRFYSGLENTSRDAEYALSLARWYTRWSLNQLTAWEMIQTQSQHLANVALADQLSREIDMFLASLDKWVAFVRPYAGVASVNDRNTFEELLPGNPTIVGFVEQVMPSDGWNVEGKALNEEDEEEHRGRLEEKCWENLVAVGELLRMIDEDGILA
ncbi:hypothetical protein AC578_2192 [Pseudocercospora eumusae]|uniref:Uncharacterized protein n=1 Tax=Pseudocercospora eumusae TaxID=321146 RepID=A0A139GYL3_9PEZI|nr:hypothetical protein AC578_2192 [Pseudocercospora eumusae]